MGARSRVREKGGGARLAPVFQTMDSAIQGINLYPRDSAIGFPNTFPLNSDLSVNSAGRRRFGISKVALCSWEDGKAKEKVFKNSTRQFRVNRAKILNRSGYVRCPEYLA